MMPPHATDGGKEPEGGARIRVRPQSACPLCSAEGRALHRDLCDRLHGAPGRWNLSRCRNPACRVLWLDPAPLPEDLPIAYRDYHTHAPAAGAPTRAARLHLALGEAYVARRYGYRPSEGTGRAARALGVAAWLAPDRRLDYDLSVMGLSANVRGGLLDVGCGAGAFLARMRDLGWSVAGVDLDPAAVRQARALGLEVHEGDLASAAHRDNRFDAVTLRHVVEHVANPGALLRECWRVLKPGGVLSAVTPNADSLGHRLFGADWRGLEPPRHLQVFTVPSLGALVARAGFQAVRCRSIAHARSTLQESWLLRRGERPGGGRRPPAWARRLLDGLGLVEQVLVLGDPRAGEEVWVQAVKGVAAA